MRRRRFLTRWTVRCVIGTITLAVMAWPIYAGPPLPADGEPSQGPPPPTDRFVPGEILVKFKPAVGELSAQRSLASRGLQATDAIPALDVLKVTVPPGRELETIAALRADAGVLYAEPNYIAYALDTNPNDPLYVNQWGLARIGAPAAWDISTGNSDVVIAVVDTGIDLDHPDLQANIWINADEIPLNGVDDDGNGYIDDRNGWDFCNSPSSLSSCTLPQDNVPNDENGHGSHVAGIAGAVGNNSVGVAGVCWGATLMPAKVLDMYGRGTYERVADGITYAVDNGANIINLSLGGTPASSTLANAVQYAYNNGVLVVAAAGNFAQSGNPVVYPAAYATTLAVAATGFSDNWATYSEHHPYVDVAAPGGDSSPLTHQIYSTVIGSYDYKYGTSMATPYVSGLAALVWSVRPGLSLAQVRTTIESSVDDLGAVGYDNYFGHGRINARRALEGLVSLQTTPQQVNFMIDDDSGPFPPTQVINVTTDSTQALAWSASISPDVPWLDIAPPASGTVSAAAPDSFTLVVPARPGTYGIHTTTVVVTATTSGGAIFGPATTEVHIHYVPNFYEFWFPIMYKN